MFSHTVKLSKVKCLKKIEEGVQIPTSKGHTAIWGELNGDDTFLLQLGRTTLSPDIIRHFHGTVISTPEGTVIQGKLKYALKTYLIWGSLLLVSLLAVIVSLINPDLLLRYCMPFGVCLFFFILVLFLIFIYSYTGRYQERQLLDFLTDL